MKVGVFLARMQPVHNGHMFLVEKACLENDKVIIILGSSNKMDMIRNPFSIELRRDLLVSAITDTIGKEHADKIEVYSLPDWSHEKDYDSQKEWGSYLYYNIVSRANTKKFSIYYSDEPSTMLDWFDNNFKERINFRFFERSHLFNGLSATKIRESFENDNIEYIKKYCPQVVINNFEELKNIWFDVKKNPKEDFSMD
jgi:cytidyltransferase-like protein